MLIILVLAAHLFCFLVFDGKVFGIIMFFRPGSGELEKYCTFNRFLYFLKNHIGIEIGTNCCIYFSYDFCQIMWG